MKVVILTKPPVGKKASIGGLTFNGRSVHLITPDQEAAAPLDVKIGDVWDIDYTEPAEPTPPHIENITVHQKRKLPPIDNVVTFIQNKMPPKVGGLEVLYDGLTQANSTGALYVAQSTGLPTYSTFFWQPDQPLVRDDNPKRTRYRYPTADGGRTLAYIGHQDPLPEIPAGTILRVSLAPWWRPKKMPHQEKRCYLQLSGWFLPHDNQPTLFYEAPATDIPEIYPPDFVHQPPLPPSYTDPAAALRQVFGYDSFWPLQHDIIHSLLNKQDTLAVMPTGSGKSLCYQLPALMFPGLTVVVSPLISLMEDQVMQLQELGVPAVALNSTLNTAGYQWVIDQIQQGRVKLLYAAPETLLQPNTLALLAQVQVDCFTVDEAHCISEWGHDFRPEYRQLCQMRQHLPDAVCLAVTATATQQVRQDIKTSLHIDDAHEFMASFNRKNLFLAVAPKIDILAQTLAFLGDHQEESGIIYCATRKQVDDLTAQLQQHGWNALPYHAGLDTAVRQRHQQQFSRDDVPIIVATIAFGMGINKSNVRFILHVDLPRNLESYYQQIGRSGRDGLDADCLLLYSYGDVNTINYFIMQQAKSQQMGARLRLEAMLGFVETNTCRRQPLLAYFNEPYHIDNCSMCDNCTTTPDSLQELTIPAQKFLSCVKRTGEIFGVNHIIDVLRGSRSQKIIAKRHDHLSTYNIGTEFSKKEWQYLARQFIQQGLLQQDTEYGSLQLTEKAYAVFKGEPVWGTLMALPTPETITAPAHDPDLFQILRAHRKKLADAADVPPYVIFSDRTLVEMATYFPQSQQQLVTIYGVGAAKLEKYAHEFLPLISDYCTAHNIEEKRKAVTSGSTTSSGKTRRQEVAEMWNNGRSLTDIMTHFQVKQSTILGHLWQAVRDGERLQPKSLLEESALLPSEQQRALDAFAQHGPDFLRPIYEALNEAVPYDALHLLRLHFVLNQDGKTN